MDIEYDILFTEVSPSVISSVTGRFAIYVMEKWCHGLVLLPPNIELNRDDKIKCITTHMALLYY